MARTSLDRYAAVIADCANRKGRYSASEVMKAHEINRVTATVMRTLGWTANKGNGTKWVANRPTTPWELQSMARDLAIAVDEYRVAHDKSRKKRPNTWTQRVEYKIDTPEAREFAERVKDAPPLKMQLVDPNIKPIRIKIGPIEIRW